MVDTCRKAIRILCALLSKRKILTLILYARGAMDREISMMHLIDDDV